jgi:MFS family permease
MLWAGRTVSMLGNAAAPIALAFAVLDMTGSVTQLGLVVGARSLANVVFILFGGIIADRLPRGAVLVGSSILSAVTQGAVAALVLTHTATSALLVALSAVNGISSAFAFPASAALTPQTVPAEIVRQAIALVRLGTNTAAIAGASAGGLLISLASPGWGLAVDAAAFATASLCFARIKSAPKACDTVAKPSMVCELRKGWTEFTARTWVWLIVVAFCFVNAAYAASNQVLGPAVADLTIGRRAWGLVLACQTAGMLIGAATGLKMRPKRPMLAGVLSVAPLALVPFTLAVAPVIPALCAAALLAGIGMEQFTISWETSLQQHIPATRLARVYSYDALGSFVAIPLAQTTAGPIAAAIGTTRTLLAAAAVIASAAVVMIANRGIRGLRSPALDPDLDLDLDVEPEPEPEPQLAAAGFTWR